MGSRVASVIKHTQVFTHKALDEELFLPKNGYLFKQINEIVKCTIKKIQNGNTISVLLNFQLTQSLS